MTAHANVDSLVESAKQIAPIIGQHAAEAEQQRRLSRPVVDAMLEAGLYGMARPVRWGSGGRPGNHVLRGRRNRAA